jgi:hypothetical protein
MGWPCVVLYFICALLIRMAQAAVLARLNKLLTVIHPAALFYNL